MKPAVLATCAVGGACFLLTIMTVTARVTAQDTSAAAYKIGVVDMREVFQKYDRRESEFQKLLGERDAAQTKVDALADKINTDRRNYENKRQTASADELERLEMQILSDISTLEAERSKLQSDVSLIESRILRDLTLEIRTVIAEIGQAENYHLILDTGSQSPSAVLYYATPLNMTSKVVDRLNKGTR
jgi:Skp family chaperone for outer membrane proteins